jgi:hypothetical protein
MYACRACRRGIRMFSSAFTRWLLGRRALSPSSLYLSNNVVQRHTRKELFTLLSIVAVTDRELTDKADGVHYPYFFVQHLERFRRYFG